VSPTDTSTTPHLLDDWQELKDFARDEVNRHPRSVRRWTQGADGLPYATLGNKTLIHVPSARAWLLRKLRKPNPRRATEHTKHQVTA